MRTTRLGEALTLCLTFRRLTSQPVMDSSVVTSVPPCPAVNVHVCIARVPSEAPPLFHSNSDLASTRRCPCGLSTRSPVTRE